jgi:hypothetical protein
MRPRRILLPLALASIGVAGECPVTAKSLPKKFSLVQKVASVNDEYDVTDGHGSVSARVSDAPGLPKVMTLLTADGDAWVSAHTDATTAELTIYDCGGGLIARLLKPATGTVVQDRDGDNVAELRFEGSTLTLSGEPKLAGEVGEKLATITQEQDGAAFQLSVEIYGQVWHHKPKEVSTTTQELIAAGRRLESNGNPAHDPTVLAVLAASEMGDSRYFVGGKLVSVSLLLVVVVCFFCCVVYCVKKHLEASRNEYFHKESYMAEADYDSDTERQKNCGPVACCSNARPAAYSSLPRK